MGRAVKTRFSQKDIRSRYTQVKNMKFLALILLFISGAASSCPALKAPKNGVITAYGKLAVASCDELFSPASPFPMFYMCKGNKWVAYPPSASKEEVVKVPDCISPGMQESTCPELKAPKNGAVSVHGNIALAVCLNDFSPAEPFPMFYMCKGNKWVAVPSSVTKEGVVKV